MSKAINQLSNVLSIFHNVTTSTKKAFRDSRFQVLLLIKNTNFTVQLFIIGRNERIHDVIYVSVLPIIGSRI